MIPVERRVEPYKYIELTLSPLTRDKGGITLTKTRRGILVLMLSIQNAPIGCKPDQSFESLAQLNHLPRFKLLYSLLKAIDKFFDFWHSFIPRLHSLSQPAIQSPVNHQNCGYSECRTDSRNPRVFHAPTTWFGWREFALAVGLQRNLRSQFLTLYVYRCLFSRAVVVTFYFCRNFCWHFHVITKMLIHKISLVVPSMMIRFIKTGTHIRAPRSTAATTRSPLISLTLFKVNSLEST